jgi:hypothetical protein
MKHSLLHPERGVYVNMHSELYDIIPPEFLKKYLLVNMQLRGLKSGTWNGIYMSC